MAAILSGLRSICSKGVAVKVSSLWRRRPHSDTSTWLANKQNSGNSNNVELRSSYLRRSQCWYWGLVSISHVLSWDLLESRGCEIGSLNDRVSLKVGRHVGNTAVETSVKFQSDWSILNKHKFRGFETSRDRTIKYWYCNGPWEPFNKDK